MKDFVPGSCDCMAQLKAKELGKQKGVRYFSHVLKESRYIRSASRALVRVNVCGQ